MSLEPPRSKTRLKNKIAYSVRASQAVLQYGVGAMVDFRDRTLMTAAPEYWGNSIEKIHDERLEKVLHVNYLGKPIDVNGTNLSDGISYVRFPEWYFCPSCRRFQPIKKWVEEYKNNARRAEDDPNMIQTMKCIRCNQELVVTRIITVCENGHIDDFPWEKWVHYQNILGTVHVCDSPSLTINTSSSTSEGLEGIVIECRNCHARASLRGAFDPEIFKRLDEDNNTNDFSCTGRHPWKHKTEHCTCQNYPKVLQRGSSSVYFPVTENSLVIPPYSSIITRIIQENNSYMEYKSILKNIRETYANQQDIYVQLRNNIKQQYIQRISQETAIPNEKVKKHIERNEEETNDGGYGTASVKYRAEEYEALSGETIFETEDYGDFLREETEIEEYKLPFIKKISLIHKVREIQALVGFTRLNPVDNSDVRTTDNIIVNVKEPETDWYPAYEVNGEGIFIEFENSSINRWLSENSAVAERVNILNENYRRSYFENIHHRKITAKFLLLHTISHLLIKQLSFECGYGIASLKERIYCSEENEGKVMSGILIYTACGDSEGTLGGLVRQGKHDTFSKIFKKAIDSAKTCSNDPVCSLSQGQGRDSLNLSACYSCSLIPETSCEEYNCFLDRGVVVGTFENPTIGFFNNTFDEEKDNIEVADFEENNDNKEDEDETLLYTLSYKGDGTDMSESAYSDIWNSMLSWSSDDNEKKLLNELINCEMNNVEKPVMNGTLLNTENYEECICDLIWKNNKTVYLLYENEYLREKIERGGWTCICGSDENISAKKVIELLGGVYNGNNDPE